MAVSGEMVAPPYRAEDIIGKPREWCSNCGEDLIYWGHRWEHFNTGDRFCGDAQ